MNNKIIRIIKNTFKYMFNIFLFLLFLATVIGLPLLVGYMVLPNWGPNGAMVVGTGVVLIETCICLAILKELDK